jgi:hypothetical protein
VASWAVVTQHWNLLELFKQREVLVNMKLAVTLFDALVQLQLQYQVLEVVFVMLAHEHDWFVELAAQVS